MLIASSALCSMYCWSTPIRNSWLRCDDCSQRASIHNSPSQFQPCWLTWAFRTNIGVVSDGLLWIIELNGKVTWLSRMIHPGKRAHRKATSNSFLLALPHPNPQQHFDIPSCQTYYHTHTHNYPTTDQKWSTNQNGKAQTCQDLASRFNPYHQGYIRAPHRPFCRVSARARAKNTCTRTLGLHWNTVAMSAPYEHRRCCQWSSPLQKIMLNPF